jgi:RNA polymerase sigma-70 factor (ECF subfamily)
MAETDSELIAQYLAGRVAALEALVGRYQRPLFGFILNMTGRREDADEVFQEVWLRAMRKLDAYREKTFLGWLVRIARNLIIDRARRRKPGVSLDAAPDEGLPLVELLPASGSDPGRRAAEAELGRRVAEAVARLPHEQKEVFLMRVEAGVPFKEIACIQGVSINTALGRMHYALARLRTELKADYEELIRERPI